MPSGERKKNPPQSASQIPEKKATRFEIPPPKEKCVVCDK
jgi:hypothetical protein